MPISAERWKRSPRASARFELMPLSKDAYEGPTFLVSLAEIYARVGEHEKSIALLERLLTIPNGPANAELQFWNWDPLRTDPRFQKLLTRR